MPPQEIYREWNIKLNIPPAYIGCHKLAPRISTSIGIPRLTSLLGKKRTQELVERVLKSKVDKEVLKLRTGGRITFYRK